MDFSENLTLPVKKQPQSLHWSNSQVSVHSGILKMQEHKIYHAYLSDNLKHDQAFVKVVMDYMLIDINLDDIEEIIIESDNCSAQYKSSQYFNDLQNLSNHLQKTVIRIFGIAGHGKGEVDHVGGTAKVAVRRETAAGQSYLDAAEIVEFLSHKFETSNQPYVFREIKAKELEIERAEASLRNHITVNGSSKFHALVFSPSSDSFKASPILCVCEQCEMHYGSCSNFEEYNLLVGTLNKVNLRASEIVEIDASDDLTDEDENIDFIFPDSIVVVPADEKSLDTVWFIKVINENISDNDTIDDYGNTIPGNTCYFSGHFLERVCHNKNDQLFKISKKVTFFYKDNVIYPYVPVVETKKGVILKNDEYTDIIRYFENINLS